MIRSDISRLNKNRSIYLKIGFVVAISMSIMAFNWTSTKKPLELLPQIMEDDIDIPIVRTPPQQKKPLPPPPKVTAVENLIKEAPEFIEQPLPEPIVSKIVAEPLPAPDIDRPIPLPAPQPKVVPVLPPVEKEKKIKEIWDVVEEMPRFPGCEDAGLGKDEKKACSDKAMLSFLYKHIKYPAIAKETTIEGTVVISFIVEKDGSISNAEILRDIGGGCGRESLRVVKKMPQWIPGRQRHQTVRVQYRLPVKFRLN